MTIAILAIAATLTIIGSIRLIYIAGYRRGKGCQLRASARGLTTM